MRSRWRDGLIGSASERGRRRGHRVTLAVGIVAATCAGLAGCGEKDPTPEQVREEAHEQLVEGGATASQATCITDRISDDLLETLSSDGRVDRDSKDFEAYSDAVVACSATK